MKTKLVLVVSASVLMAQFCLAQTDQPTDDWRPAASNQQGRQFPQVNSEHRVRYRVAAPQAQSVRVGGTKLTKGDDGVWTGISQPMDEGFHYYTVNIDGAEVPDPNSLYFYGAGRWGSGIEIPAEDQDFYAMKNVPHGQLREVHYFSKTSDSIRRIYVYTPPDYDNSRSKRYPVLYLQHGAGEDETGWGNQGHAGLIMDNLIAAGKAKPFIIVMENGGNVGGGGGRRGGAPGGRSGGFNFSAFENVLIKDLIPYIDANFRTIADSSHRAMAGLSMGGMQTHTIGLAHLDTFSQIGLFSGGSVTTNEITDMKDFKKKVKLLFVSYGSREIDHPMNFGRGGGPGGGRGGNATTAKSDIEALKAVGVNAHFYVSPLTAHEWQSWRRSLYNFAPLLFRN